MFKSTRVVLAVGLCVAAFPTAIPARGFGGGGGYHGGGGDYHAEGGGFHSENGFHEGGYGGGGYRSSNYSSFGGGGYHAADTGYHGYSSVGSYNQHLLETTPVGGASSWGNSSWGHSTWGGGIETNDMDAVARGGAVTTQHTGPAGYTVDRGVAGVQGAAVGPYGGVAGGSRVAGATVVKNPEGQVVYASGGTAARGAAVGPNGGVYGRTSAVGGYGTRYYSPTYYHAQAVGVQGWYGRTGIYGNAWVNQHPLAWHPYGYTAAGWVGAAWAYNNWNNYNDWLYNNNDNSNNSSSSAIPYDYGDNITYNNGDVYYGTQPVGTQAQYYQQAATLAEVAPPPQPADNSATPAPGAPPQWLPMGVFGLVGPEEKTPASIYQLAINKQGIIQGNCTITSTSQVAAVQGSADLKTQRCAWMVVGDKSFVVETGLYNLTQDEAPALVHFGPDHSEQCLLVRLKNPDSSGQSSASGQVSVSQSQ